MIYIWTGSLLKLMHTMQLLRILECALFWALRSFRPWLLGNLESCYRLVKADDVAQVCSPSRSDFAESKSPATVVDRLAFGGLTLDVNQDIGENSKDRSCNLPGEVRASASLFGSESPFEGTDFTSLRSLFSTPPENWIGNGVLFGGYSSPVDRSTSEGALPCHNVSPSRRTPSGDTRGSGSSESTSLFRRPSNRSNGGAGAVDGVASFGDFRGLGSKSSDYSRLMFGRTRSAGATGGVFGTISSNHSGFMFGSSCMEELAHHGRLLLCLEEPSHPGIYIKNKTT